METIDTITDEIELCNKAKSKKDIDQYSLKETNNKNEKLNNYKKDINDKNSYNISESKDLFFVRNYIIKAKLMSGIISKDLKSIKNTFNELHSAFDINTIINEYIFCSNKNLFCLVCKKIYLSPFEIIQNLECKGEFFHPKLIYNGKNEKNICNHENCKKKIIRGEYPCCHKNASSGGCLLGGGKHNLILSILNYKYFISYAKNII